MSTHQVTKLLSLFMKTVSIVWFFQLTLRLIGGLNMLRGFFIFLVFICKPSVIKMIKKRHPKMVKAFSRPFDGAKNLWLATPATATAADGGGNDSTEVQIPLRDQMTASASFVHTNVTSPIEVTQFWTENNLQ